MPGMRLLVALMAAALLTACASPGSRPQPAGNPAAAAPASSSSDASATQAPQATSTWGLIPAEWPDCARAGAALASYLDTGQPTTNDLQFGDQRQQVLSLSGDQRALYIRQQADQLIDSCDQQDNQAASASAAASAAEAQASAASASAAAQAAQQAAQERRARPACAAAGGTLTWDGGSLACGNIAYLGSDGATYYAEALANPQTGGLEAMDTGGTGANRSECASGNYPDGGQGPPGHWSTALRACLP
jgi:hypothetical protein